MTCTQRLKKPLTLHAKNFLQTPRHRRRRRECATVQCPKIRLQDGDIMWQVEFFADEGEEGDVYLCLAVKPRKVFLMATMMDRDPPGVAGREYIT